MRKLVGILSLFVMTAVVACTGANSLVDPIQGGLNDSSGLGPVPVLHPVFTRLSPRHRAQNVNPFAQLIAYFTLGVDTSTLNLTANPPDRNMSLWCNSRLVDLSLVLEDAFVKKLVLAAVGGLPPDTFCQLRMTRDIRSVEGIPMDNEYIWEFFVGSGSLPT
jgi:hypothetical protein